MDLTVERALLTLQLNSKLNCQLSNYLQILVVYDNLLARLYFASI